MKVLTFTSNPVLTFFVFYVFKVFTYFLSDIVIIYSDIVAIIVFLYNEF